MSVPTVPNHHLLKHQVPQLTDDGLKAKFGVDDVSQIPQKIRSMGQKDLQAKFELVYGKSTHSNNNEWLRRKLQEAAGIKPSIGRKAMSRCNVKRKDRQERFVKQGDSLKMAFVESVDAANVPMGARGVRRTTRNLKPRLYVGDEFPSGLNGSDTEESQRSAVDVASMKQTEAYHFASAELGRSTNRHGLAPNVDAHGVASSSQDWYGHTGSDTALLPPRSMLGNEVFNGAMETSTESEWGRRQGMGQAAPSCNGQHHPTSQAWHAASGASSSVQGAATAMIVSHERPAGTGEQLLPTMADELRSFAVQDAEVSDAPGVQYQQQQQQQQPPLMRSMMSSSSSGTLLLGSGARVAEECSSPSHSWDSIQPVAAQAHATPGTLPHTAAAPEREAAMLSAGARSAGEETAMPAQQAGGGKEEEAVVDDWPDLKDMLGGPDLDHGFIDVMDHILDHLAEPSAPAYVPGSHPTAPCRAGSAAARREEVAERRAGAMRRSATVTAEGTGSLGEVHGAAGRRGAAEGPRRSDLLQRSRSWASDGRLPASKPGFDQVMSSFRNMEMHMAEWYSTVLKSSAAPPHAGGQPRMAAARVQQ